MIQCFTQDLIRLVLSSGDFLEELQLLAVAETSTCLIEKGLFITNSGEWQGLKQLSSTSCYCHVLFSYSDSIFCDHEKIVNYRRPVASTFVISKIKLIGLPATGNLFIHYFFNIIMVADRNTNRSTNLIIDNHYSQTAIW